MEKKYNVIVESKNGFFFEIVNSNPVSRELAEGLKKDVEQYFESSGYNVTVEEAKDGFIKTLS